MDLDIFSVNNFNRRCATYCSCFINKRLHYQNIELNSRYCRGVLFDSLDLICNLKENQNFKECDKFIKIIENEDGFKYPYTIYFSTNVEYQGNIKNDMLEGPGQIFINNNIYYIGEFKENRFHGKGKILSIFCDRYDGEFYEGYVNGYGKIRWCNGSTYQGNFKKNLISGYGYYKYRNRNGTYALYEGYFKNGLRSGKGKYTSIKENNIIDFISDFWENDFINKTGEIIFRDRSYIYKGCLSTFYSEREPTQFRILPNRIGTLYYENGNIKYIGDFKNGLKDGKGEYFYIGGKPQYKGEYKFDQRNGKGRILNKDGKTVFIGHFKDDLRHGECTEIISFDKVEVSNYKHGRKFGKNVFTDSDLKPKTRYFYNNYLVSKKMDKETHEKLKDEICPICQLGFEKNQLTTESNCCKKTYHSDCIFNWLTIKDSCPMCRNENIFNKKRKLIEISLNS